MSNNNPNLTNSSPRRGDSSGRIASMKAHFEKKEDVPQLSRAVDSNQTPSTGRCNPVAEAKPKDLIQRDLASFSGEGKVVKEFKITKTAEILDPLAIPFLYEINIQCPSSVWFNSPLRLASTKIAFCELQISHIINSNRLQYIFDSSIINELERYRIDFHLDRISRIDDLNLRVFIDELKKVKIIHVSSEKDLLTTFGAKLKQKVDQDNLRKEYILLLSTDCIAPVGLRDFFEEQALVNSEESDVIKKLQEMVPMTEEVQIQLMQEFNWMKLLSESGLARLWWANILDRFKHELPNNFPFTDMRVEGSQKALECYIRDLKSTSEIERLKFCNQELERFASAKAMLGNDAITKRFWMIEKWVLKYYIAVKEMYPAFSMQELMNKDEEFKKLKKEEWAQKAIISLIENKPKSLYCYYLGFLDVAKHSDLLEIAETAMKKGDWERTKKLLQVVLSSLLLTFAIFLKAALDGFSSGNEILFYASLILIGSTLGIFLGNYLGHKEEQRIHNNGIKAMQEKLLTSAV